jgi:surface-anchored protein
MKSCYLSTNSNTLAAAPRHAFFALAIAVMACVATPARAGLWEFELNLHAEPGIASDMFDSAGDPVSEAPSSGALLPVIADAQTTRPAGSEWDFTGANDGDSLWVLPNTSGNGVLYLGIGAEEIDAADLAGPITLTFLGLSGPAGGVFSMWDGGTLAGPTPLITSASGYGLPNALAISAGGHSHFNYGFTAQGLYAVTFQATGTLAAGLGGGPVSGVGTFMFGVFGTSKSYPNDVPAPGPYSFFETDFDNFIYGDGHVDLGIALAPVPEPSSVALAGMGVAGALAAGWRRRRRAAAANPPGAKAGR